MNAVDIKPMKAPSEGIKDLRTLTYPMYFSPKVDGLRAMGHMDRLNSSSMSEFPNDHLNQLMRGPRLNGLDGELVVGAPYGQDVMRRTNSGITSQAGEPDFTLYAFDCWNALLPYHERQRAVHAMVAALPIRMRTRVQVMPQTLCESAGEAEELEAAWLAQGYEGAMARSPLGMYKFGRATYREGTILKVKRFVDSEAAWVGQEEAMGNSNEKLESGRRSTRREGLAPLGMLGTIIGMDLQTGAEVRVGPGRLTHRERRLLHERPELAVKRIFTYKHFPADGFEAPRHPVFKCWRAGFDLTAY